VHRLCSYSPGFSQGTAIRWFFRTAALREALLEHTTGLDATHTLQNLMKSVTFKGNDFFYILCSCNEMQVKETTIYAPSLFEFEVWLFFHWWHSSPWQVRALHGLSGRWSLMTNCFWQLLLLLL
jgi:hypothetical protein